MSNKEDILAKIRAAKPQNHDMPDLGALRPRAYADPLKEFVEACAATGASVIEAAPGDSIDELVRRAFPEAKVVASNAEGVTIATKNPDTVAEAAPDALVLACGGLRDTLEVEGANVVSIDDFMFSDLGDNVVVWGSNAQAFDTALWLTVHKKHVVMVTPNPAEDLDMQQSQHAMRFMTTALYALGMQVYTTAQITGAADGQITVSSADAGVEYTIPCDTIVNAADMLPNTGLLDQVDVAETYAIGDCSAPFNIALAIRGGNDAGRAL